MSNAKHLTAGRILGCAAALLGLSPQVIAAPVNPLIAPARAAPIRSDDLPPVPSAAPQPNYPASPRTAVGAPMAKPGTSPMAANAGQPTADPMLAAELARQQALDRLVDVLRVSSVMSTSATLRVTESLSQTAGQDPTGMGNVAPYRQQYPGTVGLPTTMTRPAGTQTTQTLPEAGTQHSVSRVFVVRDGVPFNVGQTSLLPKIEGGYVHLYDLAESALIPGGTGTKGAGGVTAGRLVFVGSVNSTEIAPRVISPTAWERKESSVRARIVPSLQQSGGTSGSSSTGGTTPPATTQ